MASSVSKGQDTVDGRNLANQLNMVKKNHYLQGFIHPGFLPSTVPILNPLIVSVVFSLGRDGNSRGEAEGGTRGIPHRC